jgi:CrcB protein
MKQLALVAAGGALGAVARWAIGGWVLHRTSGDFPWGTLVVNLIGCLVAGVLAGLIVRHDAFSPNARLFLMTGILGGFTTFSAFGVDTAYLLKRQEYVAALGYVTMSVVGGIAVLFAVLMAIVKAGPQK